MSGAPSQSFMPVMASSGTLDEAFPDVDPNYEPLGSLVLLQVQVAKRFVGKEVKLELPEEVRAIIQANTQVAKVVSWGPLAFCNRNTGQRWPEGAWVAKGDYIRIPKHGGDRWEIPYQGGVVPFVVFRDLELGGKVPRPLEVIAFV